jgi:hypothetical protein
MLSKIQESNHELRQIKNGCCTIFDKDYMKIKYTNPQLSNENI